MLRILDDKLSDRQHQVIFCLKKTKLFLSKLKQNITSTQLYKKYTSCGNRRYKTKTNLHEKKTAYVRKILFDFMYEPEVVFFLTPKIHCHSREYPIIKPSPNFR